MWLLARAGTSLSALILGSLVGALITYIVTVPYVLPLWVIIWRAATFMLIGALPAVIVGTIAIRVFRQLRLGRVTSAFIMMIGGGAVGAAYMSVTFGFESWGGIAGASIGLMQGLLLYYDLRGGTRGMQV